MDERDFFVSYRSADLAWAEWIAWQLEDAGYTTFVQAWDFRPGQNFVHQMQQGASSCHRTIAVLTPAYFESGFTRAEWYSAFAKDPTGEAGLLLPVRVAECDIAGLLGQIIYIDLVGLEKAQARKRLLAGIEEQRRAKPLQPPPFPDIFPDNRDIRVIPPQPPPSAEDRRGLLILLNNVERDWIKGVLEQSVQHEALINLGMEARVDLVEHPWEQVLELPDAAGKLLPADTKIADVFEDVGRLLLILGEPGSGKTMTLLELARDLVARANSDPRQPVPVVFNLSSWTERFTSLVDWLTEELNSKYRIPKRIGRPWLEANRLVLFLDGLDEVQPDSRVACLRAINAFLEDQGTTGLVVCSRLTEYTAEPIRLKMNGAICLQPLTATQIETYLLRLGSQVDALRAELHKDNVLQDLAQSPLMLSIMTLAYQRAPINELAGDVTDTPDARRRQLFNTYIHRMFARKGKTAVSAHAKEQTTRCLPWLAHNMLRCGQTVFMIEQMQPSWLHNVRQILIYLLSSRTATAALICAVGPLSQGIEVGVTAYVYAPSPQLRHGVVEVLPLAFIIWILIALLSAFWSSSIDLLRHHMELSLSTPRILRITANNQLLVMFANILGWTTVAFVIYKLFFFGQEFAWYFSSSAAIFGLIFGIIYRTRSVSRDIKIYDRLIWSWTGPIIISMPLFIIAFILVVALLLVDHVQFVRDTIDTIYVLLEPLESEANAAAYPFSGISILLIIMYLFLWPSLFLVLGLRGAVQEDEGTIVNSGIRSAVINAYRAGLVMFGCSMVVTFTLCPQVIDCREGTIDLVGAFVQTGVIASIGVAAAYGGVDVINHCVLRLIVYRNGYLPIRSHQFLDHCVKLVFLRRVGGGYIFIHRLLLEHFAAMWEAEHMQKGAKVAVS